MSKNTTGLGSADSAMTGAVHLDGCKRMTLDEEFGEVGLLQRGAKRADRLSETCYGAAKPVFEVRCYSTMRHVKRAWWLVGVNVETGQIARRGANPWKAWKVKRSVRVC
jgi:hypothetical protein